MFNLLIQKNSQEEKFLSNKFQADLSLQSEEVAVESSGTLSPMLADETDFSASDSLWLLLAFITTTKVNLFRNKHILPIVKISIKLNKIYQKKYYFYRLRVVVQTKAILFLKSISERGGSDIERL